MNKILILTLCSLLAVVISVRADHGHTEELEEVKEEENNLEVSRMERDADPGKCNNAGKRNKNGEGKNAGKRNKNGKGKNAGKRNKNGKGNNTGKRNKNGKGNNAGKRNKNGKVNNAGKRNKNGKGNNAGKRNKNLKGNDAGKRNKNGKGKSAGKRNKNGKDNDAGKRNKNLKGNNAGKRNKNGKGKSAGKRNKNGKGNVAGKRNKNGKGNGAGKRNKNGKGNNAGKRNKNRKNNNAGKRNKNGKGNGRSETTGCSRAVNSTCLDTAVKLLNLVNTKITNFLVQQKRISKYNGTGGKKSGKKGLFGPIASKVIDVGGGNASDLSCSGNKTNVGATKLKSIIASLQKCEADINTACDPTAYPLPNVTKANECKTNMEIMKANVTACTKKTGDAACTCWFDSGLKATAVKVKTCDISGSNKLVTAQHKYCTGNFSACKKIEDTAVTYIYACSQSAASLKIKAAQTKANVNALGAAKNKTSTLAGSSTGKSTVIRKRATSVSTCSDFVTLSASLLTIASDSPTSSTVATMAKILSAVSDSLSCSTTEKASLTTQVTTYTQTIAKVSATYSGLKSSVEDASGTTSDAEIVAAGEAATATTKKVAAKRNRLVRDVLNNLN